MRRRGVQAIEFALALPIFLAMVGAIVEYGYFFQQQIAVTHAVREATRAGVELLRTAEVGPEARAQQVLAENLADAGYAGSVHIGTAITGTRPDQLLEVTGQVPYDPLFEVIPVPPHVEAAVTMRLVDQGY